jgi:hypothetical protein
MKPATLAVLLASACLRGAAPAVADPQPKTVLIDPARHHLHWRAHVVTTYVDDDDTPVDRRGCCSTGDLHIIYSDGGSVAVHLNHKDFPNLADFADVRVAGDGETVGWTEGYVFRSTSYPRPVSLDIFRGGRLIFQSPGEQGDVWYWEFQNGGREAAAIFGPPHGASCGLFQLYDLKHGGKIISDILPSRKQGPCLEPAAPAWAQQLEQHYHPP